MTVDDKDRIKAIEKIVETGVRMDQRFLVMDILSLSYIFKNSRHFNEVLDVIVQEIQAVIKDPSLGEDLIGSLSGIKSVHFYSTYQKPGDSEDMRLAHMYNKDTEVLGFGHRWLPKGNDKKSTGFYSRLRVRV